jgi:hypothetical protein
VDNFDAFFEDDGVVTQQQPEQPTVGQDKPVPTSSVSVDAFFDSMTAAPAYEEDIPDTSEPEVADELSPFEDDDRYVDYYVKRMLPVPDGALESGALEQTDRMTRVERVAAERPDLTDEDYEQIAAGMGQIIEEQSKSMTGIDPISRSIMTAAGSSGTGTKLLFGFADIVQNVTAYTGDQIESFLKKAKGQQVGSYLYDFVDVAVAGGRSGKAKDERELTDRIMNMAGAGLEFSETVPALGNIVGAADVVRRTATKDAAGLAKQIPLDKKALETARRNSFESAELATLEAQEEARQTARKAAEQNKDISEQLIIEFEERTGKTVSVEVNGRKVLDPELAKQAGKDTAIDAMGDEVAPIFRELAAGDDTLFQPLLKPEKFDGIVAIASDLKKRNPTAWNDKKSVIDNLFELTVNKELDGQALIDDLNKYGLSFEDYVLTVVGSGSEAGKMLNKLSQIKRARPLTEKLDADQKKLLEAQGNIRKAAQRIEGIRRGGLVSQIATAARNLSSAAIRAPLEGLGNVMDTAMLKGAGQLISGQNWRDSFRHMSYMFSRPDIAKGYSDFILEQPEFAKQLDRMYNNINEIQKGMGRGEGGITDSILTTMENAVDVINTPNRWQEYLIRRGQFFAELQRQVRNEYGADLIDLLQQGKLRDLINDASTVKPEGKRSFINLVDDSVTKALDVTYAKQPDVDFFRETSNFIVRNHLTVVAPFPRFMFNSMELMGQYTAGASIPLTRKLTSLVTLGKVGGGPLTAKDRQRISRNLQGMAAIGAAYMYRTSDEAPAEYNQISISDDTQMDSTALYPLPQFMYLGEATKRLMDGTFDDWFNSQEFVELFVGTNVRTGVGNSILEEITSIASGEDLSVGETAGRALGRPLGNYLSTWLVPFAQVVEAERATGHRGTEYKDMASDPTLDFETTLMNELSRPFKQRGFGVSAEEEAAAPSREFLFAESKERVSPLSRVFLGLNLSTKDSEEGEYLRNLGFQDYLLGSRSNVPSIRRFENALLREYVPTVVDVAKKREKRLREIYKDKPETLKSEYTEQEFVNNNIKPFITEQINKIKTKVSEGSITQGDDYTRAMISYRRLTPEYRKQAGTDFVDRYGRTPDPLSTKDLQRLKAIGDSYKKAYK